MFCTSLYLTLVLGLERYLAVCFPTSYREFTLSYSANTRLLLYVSPVVLISILLNISKYFETRIVNRQQENIDSGDTTMIDMELTELFRDPNYIKYYSFYTRLIATGIIPVVFLTFFNIKIYQGIKGVRTRMEQNGVGSRRQQEAISELNLAIVLVCVVVVFLICHIPRILLNMFDVLHINDILRCEGKYESPAWFKCMAGFNHLLLILNSSCNFIIYCSLNQNVKEYLVKVISRLTLRFRFMGREEENHGIEIQTLATTEV
ncbi:G-protein coupled receptor daf-37 [Eurytemora carolleeae]|uniref:G-protein coupled receptor daf-37 n=1 Tax=Eurytemora carolleeae TaxID=1294199 RepID=UPI000C77ABB1|nr:G-protein coupled receptor daf-37 [Eurytemora carolleeae]|eukprot:XP_023335988.1 G-protein coupled receptor daf-37-like [Eurytemora affinis]